MLLFGYKHAEAQAKHDGFWEIDREANGVTDEDYWTFNNNPCAQSQSHLNFLNNLLKSNVHVKPHQHWDYLVLVDITSGPK